LSCRPSCSGNCHRLKQHRRGPATAHNKTKRAGCSTLPFSGKDLQMPRRARYRTVSVRQVAGIKPGGPIRNGNQGSVDGRCEFLPVPLPSPFGAELGNQISIVIDCKGVTGVTADHYAIFCPVQEGILASGGGEHHSLSASCENPSARNITGVGGRN